MYDEMTNAQLKEECDDRGIKVEAKSPGKPNKTELLAAIHKAENFEPVEYDEDYVSEEDVAKQEAIAAAPKPIKPVAPQSEAKLQRLDMMRKTRVIVHDNQDNQTKDKDEVISVSWGNRLLGGQTDFVSLGGEPQYVRRGALKNLEEATTVIHDTKASGSGANQQRRKRFIIVPVEGLSVGEIAELAAKQKMRDSKHA